MNIEDLTSGKFNCHYKNGTVISVQVIVCTVSVYQCIANCVERIFYRV